MAHWLSWLGGSALMAEAASAAGASAPPASTLSFDELAVPGRPDDDAALRQAFAGVAEARLVIDALERADVAPLVPPVEDAPWTVLDLRALRPWFHADKNREAHPELAELVFRYDAVAIAPSLTRAEPLAPLPPIPR